MTVFYCFILLILCKDSGTSLTKPLDTHLRWGSLCWILFYSEIQCHLNRQLKNAVQCKAYQKKKKKRQTDREREGEKKKKDIKQTKGEKKKEVNSSMCYVGPDKTSIFGAVVFYQACVFHAKQQCKKMMVVFTGVLLFVHLCQGC